MKFRTILAFILSIQVAHGSGIDWRDCERGEKYSDQVCNNLLDLAFNESSSLMPKESVLKKNYLSIWSLEEQLIMLSKDASLFIRVMPKACSKLDFQKCISAEKKDLESDLSKKPDLLDLSRIVEQVQEWVFKISSAQGNNVRYLYHLKQNGNYLIGYKEDYSPQTKRRHYFLFDIDKAL
jgi:hypothetical protein